MERQYQFCAICRRNHRAGKQHVFSKCHQNNLDKSLLKFSSKTELAKTAHTTQCIIQSNLDEKFWCYICLEEYVKHYILDDCAGKDGGIIQHFASSSHNHQLEVFAKLHRLDHQKLQKFSISEDQFRKYELEIKNARLVHLAKIQHRLSEEAARIAKADYENWRIATDVQWRQYGEKEEPEMAREARTRQRVVGRIGTTALGGSAVKTIEAKGDGLTCIRIKDKDERSGNVHSGALPPWLQATTSPSDGVIGPTMQDYEKHQRMERRSKLPVARVGANYSRQEATGSDWRPSFGQVWSKRRVKQRDRSRHDTKEARPGTGTAPLPALKRMKFGQQ